MNEKKVPTKQRLLNAFDESESKFIADLCKIAQVSRFTFYYCFNNDANFRQQVLEKQKAHLTAKLETARKAATA